MEAARLIKGKISPQLGRGQRPEERRRDRGGYRPGMNVNLQRISPTC